MACLLGWCIRPRLRRHFLLPLAGAGGLAADVLADVLGSQPQHLSLGIRKAHRHHVLLLLVILIVAAGAIVVPAATSQRHDMALPPAVPPTVGTAPCESQGGS